MADSSFDWLFAAYQQWTNQTTLEVVAVALGVAYLLLAMRQSLWCWPAAFGATLISAILFFDVRLPMEALLNLYYLAMAVYGFYVWNKSPSAEDPAAKTPVIIWSITTHLYIIMGATVGALLNGWFLTEYTNADYPYLDSLTTWFAVITTYMVAQKVLENWVYWLVIDGALVWLFFQKELYLFSLLMLVYCVLCFIGFFQWFKSYRTQQNQSENTVPGSLVVNGKV